MGAPMSMSSANLAAALQRVPGPSMGYIRPRSAYLFWPAPVLPIPFRWGPNGSLLLLAALLAGYGALVVAVLWCI